MADAARSVRVEADRARGTSRRSPGDSRAGSNGGESSKPAPTPPAPGTPRSTSGSASSSADSSIGGGLLAGALAYRLFVLLLPTSLLLVSGLGLYAGTVDKSPSTVAKEAGLHGLIASEVSQTASSRARGVVFLLMITMKTTSGRCWTRRMRPRRRSAVQAGVAAAVRGSCRRRPRTSRDRTRRGAPREAGGRRADRRARRRAARPRSPSPTRRC